MNGIQPGVRWPGTPQISFPNQQPLKIILYVMGAIPIGVVLGLSVLLMIDRALPGIVYRAANHAPAAVVLPGHEPSGLFLRGDAFTRGYLDENQKIRRNVKIGSEHNNEPFVFITTHRNLTKAESDAWNTRAEMPRILFSTIEVKPSNLATLNAEFHVHQQLRIQSRSRGKKLSTLATYIPPQDASDGSENAGVYRSVSEDDDFVSLLQIMFGKLDGQAHNPKEAYNLSKLPLSPPVSELPVPEATTDLPVDATTFLFFGVISFFAAYGMARWLMPKLLSRPVK